jgi:hypothetical protein
MVVNLAYMTKKEVYKFTFSKQGFVEFNRKMRSLQEEKDKLSSATSNVWSMTKQKALDKKAARDSKDAPAASRKRVLLANEGNQNMSFKP